MITLVFWNDGSARKAISEKEMCARNWYCEDQMDSSGMIISDSLGNKDIRLDHKGVTDKTNNAIFNRVTVL